LWAAIDFQIVNTHIVDWVNYDCDCQKAGQQPLRLDVRFTNRWDRVATDSELIQFRARIAVLMGIAGATAVLAEKFGPRQRQARFETASCTRGSAAPLTMNY